MQSAHLSPGSALCQQKAVSLEMPRRQPRDLQMMAPLLAHTHQSQFTPTCQIQRNPSGEEYPTEAHLHLSLHQWQGGRQHAILPLPEFWGLD